MSEHLPLTPEEHKKLYISLLKILANNTAIRFLSPIYLVGSFQDKGIEAGDIDLIMVVTEQRFYRLFRSKEWSDRQFTFIKKQKKYFEMHFDDFDVDFKVQTQKRFDEMTGPRTKLDNIMEQPE